MPRLEAQCAFAVWQTGGQLRVPRPQCWRSASHLDDARQHRAHPTNGPTRRAAPLRLLKHQSQRTWASAAARLGGLRTDGFPPQGNASVQAAEWPPFNLYATIVVRRVGSMPAFVLPVASEVPGSILPRRQWVPAAHVVKRAALEPEHYRGVPKRPSEQPDAMLSPAAHRSRTVAQVRNDFQAGLRADPPPQTMRCREQERRVGRPRNGRRTDPSGDEAGRRDFGGVLRPFLPAGIQVGQGGCGGSGIEWTPPCGSQVRVPCRARRCRTL